MVSAFVDQQPLITVPVVETVARDFDLGDSPAVATMSAPPPPAPAGNLEKFDVVEALRTLATLAERLRESDQDLPKERKL
jgi:hypothetical protein